MKELICYTTSCPTCGKPLMAETVDWINIDIDARLHPNCDTLEMVSKLGAGLRELEGLMRDCSAGIQLNEEDLN